jgi:hypothetical protein
MLLTSCVAPFPGFRGAIQFESNILTWLNAWTPSDVVAAGTEVTFTSQGIMPVPSLAEGHVVGDPSAVPGAISGTLMAGTSTVQWEAGETWDVFSVQSANIGSVVLTDPLRLIADLANIRTNLGPDLGEVLTMAPGASMAVGVVLEDDEGNPLAGNETTLQSSTAGPFSVRHQGLTIVVQAPNALGAEDELAVGQQGTTLASMTLRTVNPLAITSIELVPFTGVRTGVRAIARLEDGTVVSQPPIAWRIDERLRIENVELPQDPSTRTWLSFEPRRTDVVALVPNGALTETINAEIVARVGQTEARITLPFGSSTPPPPPPAPAPINPFGSCQSAGGVGWMGLLLLLMRKKPRVV